MIKRFLIITIILNLLTLLGIAWANAMSPEEVVQKFCHLDAEGKRLSGDTWIEIAKFTTLVEDSGEMMVIIEGFKVDNATISDNTATVSVDYQLIGSTDTIEFTKPSKKWANPYIYRLVKQDSVWKIDAPISAPHVYWEIVVSHLKELQKREPVRREQLESIINQIINERSKLKK